MTLTTELNAIILHFPHRMWGGWMDLEVLHESIKRGDFPFVSRKDVSDALKGLSKVARVMAATIKKWPKPKVNPTI
jgi:hypothetical protein